MLCFIPTCDRLGEAKVTQYIQFKNGSLQSERNEFVVMDYNSAN